MFGWVAAFSAIVSGEAKEGSGFVLFWLIAWTVGGIFAFWFLFRLLRPSVPEELLLTVPSLVYDSGTPPFTMSFDYRSQMDVWKKMFRKRKRVEFDQKDIHTLRLRDIDSGNRLTIDKGAERFELGSSLTEVEREWLFATLAGNTKSNKVVEPARYRAWLTTDVSRTNIVVCKLD